MARECDDAAGGNGLLRLYVAALVAIGALIKPLSALYGWSRAEISAS